MGWEGVKEEHWFMRRQVDELGEGKQWSMWVVWRNMGFWFSFMTIWSSQLRKTIHLAVMESDHRASVLTP